MFTRTWLYSEKYPAGKIFSTEESYNEAVKAGFVEAPEEIGLDPAEIKKRRAKNITLTDAQRMYAENEKLKIENEKLYFEKEELKDQSAKLKERVAELEKFIESSKTVKGK